MRRSVPGYFHTLEPFLDLFKTGVPILMYHKIGLRPPRVRLRGLYVRQDVLVRQLDELQQAGFTSCPPAEANVRARTNGAPARRVVLTFDDGFRNVFENASSRWPANISAPFNSSSSIASANSMNGTCATAKRRSR